MRTDINSCNKEISAFDSLKYAHFTYKHSGIYSCVRITLTAVGVIIGSNCSKRPIIKFNMHIQFVYGAIPNI